MSDERVGTVAVDAEVWDATQRRLARLEAALARIERAADADLPASQLEPDRGVGPGPTTQEPVVSGDRPEVLGRRQAFAKLAGAAAAAGVVAGVVGGGTEPAAAANGDAMVLGSNSNLATAATGTAVTGSSVDYGLGVTDNGYSSTVGQASLFAHANETAFRYGIKVIAENNAAGTYINTLGGGTALLISAAGSGLGISVQSHSLGLDVTSFQGSAARLAGQALGASIDAQQVGLQITAPQHLALAGTPFISVPAPPTAGAPHKVGDLVVDTNGVPFTAAGPNKGTLWFCVADGTPGTWREVAGPSTAGAFHVLPVPVRIYDSRPGTTPSTGPKTPLVSNTPRPLDVTVNNSKVPVGATAVMVNLLLVDTVAGNGNFTVWAGGAARPAANNMVWGGNAGRFSSLAVTALDAAARCQVVSSLQTDVVVDVVGYYR